MHVDSAVFLLIFSDCSSYYMTFLRMLNWLLDQIFQDNFSEDEKVLLAIEYLQQVSQFIPINPKMRLQIPHSWTPSSLPQGPTISILELSI